MLAMKEKWIPFICSCLAVLFGFAHAFQCQSCSYSYSDEQPDKDTACVYKPNIYTGWSVLKCKDSCVVQEVYSKEKQRVVAYWRSCSDKAKTGYCQGDQWLLTCYHSCQGDLCNSWVKGQLHTIYGDITAPDSSGNGADSMSRTTKTFSLAVTLTMLLLPIVVEYVF